MASPIQVTDDYVIVNLEEVNDSNRRQVVQQALSHGLPLVNTKLKRLSVWYLNNDCGFRTARKASITKSRIMNAIDLLPEPSIRNIAKSLHCNYDYLRKRIADLELHEYIKQRQQETVDKVESVLIDKALEGNVTAAKLFLESRAKDRGYGQAKEDVKDLKVQIVFSEAGGAADEDKR